MRADENVIHRWHDISPGEDVPKEFNAITEIPLGSNVKYELDAQSGLLRMDRVLYSAVYYPANYGFIPQTVGKDGDALDVLVPCQEPVVPLTIIHARRLAVRLYWMLRTRVDYAQLAPLSGSASSAAVDCNPSKL